MAFSINHIRLLLLVATILVMVVASVDGEALPDDSMVKQASAKRDMIWKEVFHDGYGDWSPTPKVRRGNPAPILLDITQPPP
ncbi:unnamed protein product [Eruca vesicaria subsp. sativa]|uniref:Uncharacterized protein n=1 Tax=Eruca vesicaria subsp. sativa TaxID=29727 RepID=A0ABC8LAG3_ERUVS|nr:unnamed protein product [Eruca vesicaria subsp. sativa]